MEVFTVFTADGVTESRAFSSNLLSAILQKWTELSAILQIWAEIYKNLNVFWKRAGDCMWLFYHMNHLPFFKRFSNFVHFYPYFQMFCPFWSFFNIFYPFLRFFWKITHMPLLSRIDPGFLVMTICAYCYFGIFGVKCLTPAKIILWKPALLVVELCFGASVWNATLERLFNDMNLVKTTAWNRLSNHSWNSILQIHISGISMQTFRDVYIDKCIQYSYNTKNHCQKQKNLQSLQKREKKKKNYILKLVTFLHLQVITPCQRVNK